jgi:urea transport system permease protein
MCRAQPTGSFHADAPSFSSIDFPPAGPPRTHALTAAEARGIAIGETEARVEALNKAAPADDKTAAFLQALSDDAVKFAGDKVFVMRDDKGFDPVTGAELPVPAEAEDVINNNRCAARSRPRRPRSNCSPRTKLRREGAIKVLQGEADESKLPLIEKALAAETNHPQGPAGLMRSAVLLSSADKAKRLAAAAALAQSGSPAPRPCCSNALKEETIPKSRRPWLPRCARSRTRWPGATNGWAFSGISLGSILLLVALGLAITYGLMGVINMAHGELMMIGAYATYVVQGVFQKYLPGASTGTCWRRSGGLHGLGLDGRRTGAQRDPLPVRPPAGDAAGHLGHQPDADAAGAHGVRRAERGGGEPGLDEWRLAGDGQPVAALQPHGHHRFCGGGAAGRGLADRRTRLGLFVRGVTQNRPIASCMGVNTARIDTYAFALGSGIAGLAGCALSQVGNVGPDLGQGYIVDSFMVVVLGGVGQLAGTVYAALGLGVLNKFLEGWAGAVLAKIAVLVFIIIFIQKRPQGIFAMKGRSAEA